MTSIQDQLFSDYLQAMKADGAILFHPRDADDDKFLFIRFQSGHDAGYKERVPLAVWDRLIKHPQVKRELKGKWVIYRYCFEGDKP